MSVAETTNTLNSYLLGPVLGIGTYGEVRFAIHKDTGKQVALKMVDLSRFRADTATLMLREVNIVRKLNHQHVIKVLDVMRDEPFSGTFCSECACTVFRRNKQNPSICLSCSHENTVHKPQQQTKPMLVISQELAPGGELFSILMHGGALPEAVARHYFAQLLTAVDHCHSREVIHRDIKPENIVFDRQRLLKLVDFGLAACLDDKPENSVERNLSVLHSGVGSKPYSAPEVSYTREMYNATGYKGKPADLWSCAVVLFVMLTGRPPFYRPLLRSFNADLQKCKHFVRIIKGQGYEGVPPLARDLLMQLFKLNPDDRLPIEEIRKHPWMTQQLDGPFGALPVSGVNTEAECEDVLAHAQYWVDLKIQNQVYSNMNDGNGGLQSPQSNKQSFTLGDVEYFVDEGIPYHIHQQDTQIVAARRQSYQHLCGWMLQRVRTAWDAMQRPDMVYALQTAFAQDEQLALQQAQNALTQQMAAQQQYSQAHASGHVATRNFQQPQAVFGLPPSPVVLPNQGGAPIPPIQPLSISAQNASRSPQHSMTQHSLTQHNQGYSQGIPIGGGDQHHEYSNSMLVPLFPTAGAGNNNNTNYPASSLSQSGFLSQNQQQQQQRDREVAGTPLQQSLVSSLATPGFSPSSPAVFGKMGQSIPQFGSQYILNNNNQQQQQQPQQQQQYQQQQYQQQQHHQYHQQQQQQQPQYYSLDQNMQQQQGQGGLSQQLMQQRRQQQQQQQQNPYNQQQSPYNQQQPQGR